MIIKILLVDDHENVRKGLRNILTKAPGVEVVGETGDGKEALKLDAILEPDIMLLDVEMPGMKGYEVAQQMVASGSSTTILALSGYNEKEYILGMFASGAVGYLTKDEAPDQLLTAVSDVAAGRRGWLSPKASKMLGVPAQPTGQRTIPVLNPLEKQILIKVKEGKSDREISRELNVEFPLLLENIRSLIKKLGAQSRLEVVFRAMQADLI
jgi:DNA-binding NarL/FixJ family response regulator